MDGSPFRDRRFSPPEVRRILRRAAELAEQDAGTSEAERPLTQDEIERLGGELGLPPTAIRSAVHGDAQPAHDASDAPFGPRRIVFEDEIEGELPASRQEDVLDAISAVIGDAGRAQVVGRTLTWTPTPIGNNQQRQLTVTVRARDGKTRVRVDENLSPLYFGLYFGLGFGLGFGGGAGVGVPLALVAKSALLGFGVLIVFTAIALGLASLIYHAVHRGRVRALGQLRGRIEKAVREGIRVEAAKAGGRKRIAENDEAAESVEAEAEAEAELEVMRRGAARG